MGSELMLGGGGQSDDRRAMERRPSRGVRNVQRRADAELSRLVNNGRYEDAKAMIRKRLTEDGLQDVVDIYRLGDELAASTPGATGLLAEIVQEYARTTARDIRDFGRRRSI
ncbi:hypothetical protein [Streptomyces sp. NPDC056401]|uniref:hypothetical protein n=1 Tax=Streptomyces sp. NPDC056401 TaxID=3345809 RepID=UPI0035E2C13D